MDDDTAADRFLALVERITTTEGAEDTDLVWGSGAVTVGDLRTIGSVVRDAVRLAAVELCGVVSPVGFRCAEPRGHAARQHVARDRHGRAVAGWLKQWGDDFYDRPAFVRAPKLSAPDTPERRLT